MKRIQMSHMSTQLFNGASTECIACSDQNLKIILDQPERNLQRVRSSLVVFNSRHKYVHFKAHITNLRQICRFTNAVHATEGNDVRFTLFLCFHRVAQNVDSTLR